MLELHRSLGGWREWSSRMTSKELWRRRVPLTCYGTTAFGLQPEDELVALSAHAGKRFHLFARMIWSVDLAVVVQAAGPALDWDRVARVARRAGCTTVVAVGLRHARRLGADVPDELLLLPASRLRRAALAPLLSEEWPLLDPVAGGHHRLVYALWDSWARRMLAGLREVSVEGFSQAPRHAKEEVGLAVRRVRAWRGVEVPDRAPVPSVSSSRGDQAP
jgi:hypothetical protein